MLRKLCLRLSSRHGHTYCVRGLRHIRTSTPPCPRVPLGPNAMASSAARPGRECPSGGHRSPWLWGLTGYGRRPCSYDHGRLRRCGARSGRRPRLEPVRAGGSVHGWVRGPVDPASSPRTTCRFGFVRHTGRARHARTERRTSDRGRAGPGGRAGCLVRAEPRAAVGAESSAERGCGRAGDDVARVPGGHRQRPARHGGTTRRQRQPWPAPGAHTGPRGSAGRRYASGWSPRHGRRHPWG